MRCSDRLMVTVNGEQVIPQPGGFYGGWITSWVVGPFKGIRGPWRGSGFWIQPWSYRAPGRTPRPCAVVPIRSHALGRLLAVLFNLDTTSVQLETTPVQIGNPTGEVFVPCCRKLRTRSDVVADVAIRHDRLSGQLHDAR
jgi:hypothetical protein